VSIPDSLKHRFSRDLSSIQSAQISGPEGFEVAEIPLYEPCGSGEHVYLWVEKVNENTEAVARAIANGLGIPRMAIGVAGNKDRHACTLQYFSATYPGEIDDCLSLDLPGARVLSAVRHGNKLRTGHLKGNRFVLRFSDPVEDDVQKAQAVMAYLGERGMPNDYGPQRFGRDRDNHHQGKALLLADRPGRIQHKLARLYLSAYQAWLFNRLLLARWESISKIWAGDLAVRHPIHHRCFLVQDAADEQARVDKLEISPTGPIYGYKMQQPKGQALELEQAVLAEEELPQNIWKKRICSVSLKGTRRPLRVLVQNGEVQIKDNVLEVRFDLPAGSYATRVLYELTGAGA